MPTPVKSTPTTSEKSDEMSRNDVSVKLDAAVAKEAKLVATYRGVPVAQYISEVLAPIVRRDLQAEVAKMAKESKGGGK
jgi:hypothetical protein